MPWGRRRNSSSLLKTSLGRLEQVATRTTETVVDRYRRELHQPRA